MEIGGLEDHKEMSLQPSHWLRKLAQLVKRGARYNYFSESVNGICTRRLNWAR